MLDKNLIYAGYMKSRTGGVDKGQSPTKKFKRVKILYEDDISYYVESLTNTDAAGFGIRYSAKKHIFGFVPLISLDVEKAPLPCKYCPLFKAAIRMNRLKKQE